MAAFTMLTSAMAVVYLNVIPQPWIRDVRSGDFNGDGHADVYVVRGANHDNGATKVPLSLLLGDGKGGLSLQSSAMFVDGAPLLGNAGRSRIADFNGDGVDDIYFIDEGVDNVGGGHNRLFLSTPDHRLLDATNLLPKAKAPYNHGASVGDVNGDGRLDIVTNSLMKGGSSLQLQNEAGEFIAQKPSAFGSPFQPDYTMSALIDLNKDEHPDLILGTWKDNGRPSKVYLNDGTGNFDNAKGIDLPRSKMSNETVVVIEPIDLNGDDLPDLILSVADGNKYNIPYIQFLVNDGDGEFHDETEQRMDQDLTPADNKFGHWYHSLYVVDMNHDGFMDIATSGNWYSSYVYLNDGQGRFSEEFEVPYVWTVAAVADFDEDGMADLATANFMRGGVEVFRNTLENKHIYKTNFGGGKLLGASGDDTFYASKGKDSFDGGAGFDTVIFGEPYASYVVLKTNAGVSVTNNDNPKNEARLANMERLEFADRKVELVEPVGPAKPTVGQAPATAPGAVEQAVTKTAKKNAK